MRRVHFVSRSESKNCSSPSSPCPGIPDELANTFASLAKLLRDTGQLAEAEPPTIALWNFGGARGRVSHGP